MKKRSKKYVEALAKVEKGKAELEVIVTIDKKKNIINLSEKILRIKDIICIKIL